MENKVKERFIILIGSIGQWYDGTDINPTSDPEDISTPEMDNAKRFDTYGEALDFIDKSMPENDIYQINKVRIKGDI